MQLHGCAQFRMMLFALLVVGFTGLVGCKAAATKISGRVIAGNIGQSVVVGPRDERLKNPGIPGVEITVLHAGGSAKRGRGLVASGLADENGDFDITIPRGKHPASSVMIRVKGENIFASRSQTYLPTNAQKLLCTVITRDGYTPPVPEEQPKE